MQYMKCKCGNRECWTTMGAPSCEVCEQCGSTLGYGPNSHPEPTPHEFRAHIDGGEINVRCFRCHEKGELADAVNRTEIEAQVEALRTKLTA